MDIINKSAKSICIGFHLRVHLEILIKYGMIVVLFH